MSLYLSLELPKINAVGLSAFRPQGEQQSHLMGVISEGRFESYFKGKSSPLLESDKNSEANATDAADTDAEITPAISGVIERSPESARIILFSSNDFLTDQFMQMTGSAAGGEYLNSVQLVANAVDWSLEDSGLLSIRSRGHFNRTLPNMEQGKQLFWEYTNYGLALLALLMVAGVRYQVRRIRQQNYQQLLTE